MKPRPENPTNDFIRELTRAQSAIGAYIRSLLPMHPDYMDILQEVNVTLWKKMEDFQAGTNFKAWAFATARYHVMSARRDLAADRKRLVFSEDVMELLAESAPSHDDRLPALLHCLGKLRDQDRELLRMRYASNFSIEEYARRHDRNPGTVRAILRRLRLNLLTCIESKLSPSLPPGPNQAH
jgi:RNA polymerase sigma-70 factor (ECF subfamily)